MLVGPDGKPVKPNLSMFPSFMQLPVREPGKPIRNVMLHFNADGTCHGGDNPNGLQDVLDAIATLPGDPNLPMIWLMANAVRRQMQEDSQQLLAQFSVSQGPLEGEDLNEPVFDFLDTPA